jgi:hypothetical protein
MWQLQNKMAAAAAGDTYAARLQRVISAASNAEQRLQKRIELVDAYARVVNMIEIEVEMDTEVPVAEVLGELLVGGWVGGVGDVLEGRARGAGSVQ